MASTPNATSSAHPTAPTPAPPVAMKTSRGGSGSAPTRSFAETLATPGYSNREAAEPAEATGFPEDTEAPGLPPTPLTLPPPPNLPPPPGAPGTPVDARSAFVSADALLTEVPRKSTRPDPLDPATRHAAQLAPFGFTPQPQAVLASTTPTAPAEAQARTSMEALLPELVRKVAWTGDGKRGSMRLELGAGSLAGGTLTVHADAGRVRVELDAPTGTDVAAWKAKLEERLERRGVAVEEVTVT